MFVSLLLPTSWKKKYIKGARLTRKRRTWLCTLRKKKVYFTSPPSASPFLCLPLASCSVFLSSRYLDSCVSPLSPTNSKTCLRIWSRQGPPNSLWSCCGLVVSSFSDVSLSHFSSSCLSHSASAFCALLPPVQGFPRHARDVCVLSCAESCILSTAACPWCSRWFVPTWYRYTLFQTDVKC